MPENTMVFDCDGHIIESIAEMLPFHDAVDLDVALAPRNRQALFASLDNIHYPRPNEWILPYIIKQRGTEGLAYASDYTHEVV